MAEPLAGRRALVTGADSGIGRAIAAGLEAAGADVVRHRLGGDAPGWLEADFTRAGAAAGLAAAALEGGPVDILIANAAIERRRPWVELDDDAIEAHVAANFASLVALCRTLVPPMAARGWGRVVALGSVMAARPRAETLAYAAMKSAQSTALRAIAREVAGQGVTVNVISPGAIETERTADRYADADFRRAVVTRIPAGRQGQPVDCVAPVVMLCSDGAGYVTGADIPVDGGWTLGDAPGVLPGDAR